MKILVLSGPNLHRLGRREPEIYGTTTLEDVHAGLVEWASAHGVTVVCKQSNHEGELVTWLGDAREGGFAGVVFNPGAYTHSSYALYDAIRGAEVPVVEVHISNPEAREEFRKHSVVAPACLGKVAGFGVRSYLFGLQALVTHLGG
jgi:3-dehydroquinate dehydratase II